MSDPIELLKFARNKKERERIISLIQYIQSVETPNIFIYKNIILVNRKFVICNDEVAKWLLKEYSDGFLTELIDKKVSVKHLKRYVYKFKKQFELISQKFSDSDILVKPICPDNLNHVYFKWNIQLKIQKFNDELYKKYSENEVVYITLLTTEYYSEEYFDFLKLILRFYFSIDKFTLENITCEKVEKISPYTKLIFDPKNRVVYVISCKGGIM